MNNHNKNNQTDKWNLGDILFMMVGAFVIFLGIGTLPYILMSPIYLLIAPGIIALGVYLIMIAKARRNGRKPRTHFGSEHDSDFYPTTHYGGSIPNAFYTQSGKYVSTTGSDWRHESGGRSARNIRTGESVEYDMHNNLVYKHYD